MGYEGDRKKKEIKKTYLSREWRFIVHVSAVCLSHRKEGYDAINYEWAEEGRLEKEKKKEEKDKEKARAKEKAKGKMKVDESSKRHERLSTPETNLVTEEEAKEDALARELLKTAAMSPAPTQSTSEAQESRKMQGEKRSHILNQKKNIRSRLKRQKQITEALEAELAKKNWSGRRKRDLMAEGAR
ncbi:hypothetical protein L1987_19058 [Smallanthus sonchifolius]|uniref:Uncharacterized protein n=1 Tax=Smallanthus sonchifolius TaxID=185202 RepID=A0ACB9J2G5_9ASTR|nr:hypothetical protein L1987_19058 [Smallanthus sonchifolius]